MYHRVEACAAVLEISDWETSSARTNQIRSGTGLTKTDIITLITYKSCAKDPIEQLLILTHVKCAVIIHERNTQSV
jgi:hypothetical protein